MMRHGKPDPDDQRDIEVADQSNPRMTDQQKQWNGENDIRLWRIFAGDRSQDLAHIIIEVQGSLITDPGDSEPHKEYNRRLRKIISELQDLRDALPNLTNV